MKILKSKLFSFLALYVLAFFLSFSILHALSSLKLFNQDYLLGASAIVALLISLVVNYIIFRQRTQVHSTRSKRWFHNNLSIIILGYALFLLFCMSVRKDVFFDYERAASFISIQWTIFAISIAIILVYCSSIAHDLKSRNKTENIGKGIAAVKALYRKDDFYTELCDLLTPFYFLALNLFFLTSATSWIFVESDISTLSQTVLLLSFYLSTNSLGIVFLRVAFPTVKRIKSLKDDYKITAEEINRAIDNALLEEFFLRMGDKYKDLPIDKQDEVKLKIREMLDLPAECDVEKRIDDSTGKGESTI